MPDLWDTALEGIADDFERHCPGLAPITVNQIDPDTGSITPRITATLTNVPALKRVRRAGSQNVGGGEIGVTACRFTMRADRLGFVPKPHDQIVEQDGTTWVVNDDASAVELIAFGQLAAVNVILLRANTQ